MSKESSPAFQFYVKDFISGTVHMTSEEVGAYIRLLCFQWEHGSIPDDKKVLIRISGAKKGAIDEVLKKFKQTEQGLINLRLNVTREEQLAYREKQRLNGGKGGRPKNETQINPVVNFGLLNSEPNTEPKKSSSPSSSSSINNIYLSPDATSSFHVGLTLYHGTPSQLLESEHKIWFDQKLYGTGVSREFLHKTLDDKFKADSFSTTQHFRNAVKSVLDQLIQNKNGNNKKYSGNQGATPAIRSGNVKNFGDIKL